MTARPQPAAFRALADGTRRDILDLLRRRDGLTAGEIARRFPRLSRPAVSKHLAVLRRSRLVRARKHGREQRYTLNAEPLEGVAQWVAQYEAAWQQQLGALKGYVEGQDALAKEEDDAG
jgi:DNA-binding transcriptional ArsR family regulator